MAQKDETPDEKRARIRSAVAAHHKHRQEKGMVSVKLWCLPKHRATLRKYAEMLYTAETGRKISD